MRCDVMTCGVMRFDVTCLHALQHANAKWHNREGMAVVQMDGWTSKEAAPTRQAAGSKNDCLYVMTPSHMLDPPQHRQRPWPLCNTCRTQCQANISSRQLPPQSRVDQNSFLTAIHLLRLRARTNSMMGATAHLLVYASMIHLSQHHR
jgi:hypothetical protein